MKKRNARSSCGGLLWGVPTREVNRAVKKNPEKFLKGYIIELNTKELSGLRWKFSTANTAKRRTLAREFTGKGLYMLATILKSKQQGLLKKAVRLSEKS